MGISKSKSNSRETLLRVLAPLLKECGFRKQRFRWCRPREAVIQIFDVQRSAWSDYYYINLGIYDSRLGKATCPPIYECHAQLLTTALELPRSCTDDALDFAKRVNARERQILRIAQIGIAWLDQVSTLTGMRRYLRSRVSKHHWVTSDLRELYHAA